MRMFYYYLNFSQKQIHGCVKKLFNEKLEMIICQYDNFVEI